MKKLLLFLLLLILILFLYCYFIRKGGCCIVRGKGKCDTCGIVRQHWINWNVLFTPASVGGASGTMQQFEDSLRKWVQGYNPSTILSFEYHHCPCDSLLTNMDVTAVFPSGQPVNPPPTKPPIGPSGDFTVGNNFMTYTPEFRDSTRSNIPDSAQYPLKLTTLATGSKPPRLLAVIDTGLDTVRYHNGYPGSIWDGDLLWKDPIRKKTIYDVVIGEDTNELRDQTIARHGTAVTEIALNQIHFNRGATPKIMSIRAFDDSEIGSIYTVSCAMSYAIQNNADFINASWGYYGLVDSILLKYLLLADAKNIRVVAAAGNTPGSHAPGNICSPLINNNNDLKNLAYAGMLFYPAALAPEIGNLVSVTQLHYKPASTGPIAIHPCYYQNFGAEYVTVGAIDLSPTGSYCCELKTLIMMNPIEGSSFATPTITAHLMNALQDRTTSVKAYIDAHAAKAQDTRFTLNGNYFDFRQLP
jgi:hypothetical protein